MSWLEELRVNDLKEELAQRGLSYKSNSLKKDLCKLSKM